MSDLTPATPDFAEITRLIASARQRAYQAVNTALIELYWQVGAYPSGKIKAAEWGEGVVLSPAKVSPQVTQSHPGAASVFKDRYLAEFLDLPAAHLESDLQHGLLAQLKQFLLELGRDFCFIGSEYPLQVGKQDFALDLLFFHRGLNSLVAIELKTTRFSPEHLGQLNFYLEALDRDHKKPHENPAIGLLLCASKDDEVVEYALSRSLSPALVAQYQTQLPDRKLLQAKLHEFYLANLGEEGVE